MASVRRSISLCLSLTSLAAASRWAIYSRMASLFLSSSYFFFSLRNLIANCSRLSRASYSVSAGYQMWLQVRFGGSGL